MPYVQYMLPGTIVMSIFMMVMIGGGIIYLDDKARGLHEGYLVTPITKFELIAGFNVSGTIKAVLAGVFLMVIGSVIAGIPNPFDVMRLLRLFIVIVITSFALISMMFLIMVRVTDPLLPRAIFGVLNLRATGVCGFRRQISRDGRGSDGASEDAIHARTFAARGAPKKPVQPFAAAAAERIILGELYTGIRRVDGEFR